MTANPFDLSRLPALARPVLRWLARIDLMQGWYEGWRNGPRGDVQAFLDDMLAKIGRGCTVVNPEALAAIPETGPLVLVANHPLGALEGMMIPQQVLARRPDLKVLANTVLCRIPEFSELFIGIDVLGNDPRNAAALRQAHRHLAAGGALLVFPAGTVGHLPWGQSSVIDAPWQRTAARLALAHGSACLPIHVEARNSRLFYLSGQIHKRLRTLLLPRAMVDRRGAPVRLTFGSAFTLADAGIDSAQAGIDYLRLTCELLGSREPARAAIAPSTTPTAPTVTPVEPQSLAAAVAALAPFEVLRQGHFSVFCAPYAQLGVLATHLASEREVTFRAAGEGTGQALDNDRFDGHYQHLLAWDHSANALIGAYRAARVSDVLADRGRNGLYSHSLFHYPESFAHSLKGSIEVGRSFVTLAYQRNPRALDLLWQGLGAMMMRNTDCHTFIGCVSISNAYAPVVRALLHDGLLTGYRVERAIYDQVKPSSRFRYDARFWRDELMRTLGDVGAINKLLGHAGLEWRVPVLIRHYLALNGRFIDFSVNHDFSQSLDGLILVDLRKAPDRSMSRYLGKEGLVAFKQRWSVDSAA